MIQASLLALAIPLLQTSPRVAEISNGAISIAVNELGVLVDVPPGGLRTVDGPLAELGPHFAEWFAVSFTSAGGPFSAAAAGALPDWTARRPVQPISFAAGRDWATALVRAGDMEIETTYRFDREGPYLLVTAALRNAGASTLGNIFYTREWLAPGSAPWTFPDDMAGAIGPAPGAITRSIWMFDDLPPGASTGATFSFTWGLADSGGDAVDVPLSLWTHPSFPAGLVYGATNGISWGDYDADGWIDVYATQSARLWRNLSGSSWQLVGDFDQPPTQLLLPTTYRYGCSFGDYDADGLPDIPIEPRSGGADPCFHLLHNLGGGPSFAEVAGPIHSVISEPCGQMDSETICWGDVENDGDLDLFLPVYPPTGNFFWTNDGPSPGGPYTFTETSAASGVDNPPGAARPEGAQFCDVDFDGDLDLYSNGTLYQNRSTAAGPIDFDALSQSTCGIGLASSLDEGAMLFDYDRDGDFDVFVVYTSQGVKIWESQGDGTFFEAEAGIIQSPLTGLNLGMSAEDWDGDGDIDFTTRQVFRRNMLVETGARSFVVATHSIPAGHITSATPAWGDWDRDGDLDCALSNWLELGRFYENSTYGAATPLADRRHVRVAPLRDSAAVPAGLQTEFGAVVEVRIAGETARRKKFTSSAGGYLNQNEYTLTFGLPADPFPADPASDLRFDVAVDFPTLASQGIHRVDRHVNPALGEIDFATLADREIQVFRSGRVRIDGCEILPAPIEAAPLRTTAAGLALPSAATPIPAPAPAPGPNHFVGLDFDTLPAGAPVRVAEIVLDGRLDAAVTGPAGPFNLALWDVTDPTAPRVHAGGWLARSTSMRNRRTSFPVNWILPPGRHFRLVARVTQLRATTIAGPLAEGPVTTLGGLFYADAAPTTGAGAVGASVDPTRVYLAIRFREAATSQWSDLGGGLLGSGPAVPLLTGSGLLVPGNPVQMQLSGAPALSPAAFGLGVSVDCQPLPGGALIPDAPVFIGGFATDASGSLTYPLVWPSGIPSTSSFAIQFFVFDPAAPLGVAGSNALWFTAP